MFEQIQHDIGIAFETLALRCGAPNHAAAIHIQIEGAARRFAADAWNRVERFQCVIAALPVDPHGMVHECLVAGQRASAAAWLMELALLVDWDWSVSIAAIRSAGPAA